MANKMKKGAATVISFSLVGTLLTSVPQNVSAEQMNTAKEENVYAILEHDGSVQDIYVVNAYDLSKNTTIVDYGTYSSVKNLSNKNEIKQKGDCLTVEASKGKFYYQGNLDTKNLPWNIKISYYLDGKEIKGEDLAGKSGNLQIKTDIKQNKKVDDSFFEKYFMQATVSLPSEHCTNIKADGATIANMSGDKQIMFNVMGGQEKTLTVSADVTDFEMSAISFKGVPMSFDIDVDELDTSELTEKTSEIEDGVNELNDGAKKLSDGTNDLEDGLKTYTSGVDSLYSGATALAKGVDALYDGTTNYTKAAAAISEGADTFAKKTADLPKLLKSLEDAVKKLADGSAKLSDKENGAAAQITSALKQIEGGLTQMKAGLTAMDEKAITPMLLGLNEMETKMTSLEGGLESMNQYVTALQQIQAEYQSQAEMLAGVLQTLGAPAEQTEENIRSTSGEQIGALNQLYGRMSKNAGMLGAVINGSEQTPALSAVITSCKGGVTQAKTALFGETETSMRNVLTALKTQISGENGAVSAVDTMIAGVQQLEEKTSGEKESLQTNLESLNSGLKLLNENVKKLPKAGNEVVAGVKQLQTGLHQLNENSGALIDGAKNLQSGAGQLNTGAEELSANNKTILDGVDTLSDGIGTLKDGTEEFADKTTDMDKQIIDGLKDGLNNFTGQDYEGISYVSEENTNINAVQFAVQTEAVSVSEEAPEEEVKEKQTLWEKLKALF